MPGHVAHLLGLVIIVVVVLPLRLLLVLLCAASSLIACTVFAGDGRAAPPQLVAVHRVIGRLLLVAFGVWPGLLTVRGQQERAPVLIVAPHCGALDGFFFLMHGMPRPVALAPYARLPVVGLLFRAARGVAVPLPKGKPHRPPVAAKACPPPEVVSGALGGGGSGDGGGSGGGGGGGVADAVAPASKASAVRAAIREHKASFDAAAGDASLVLFPEGCTHNGRALLTFFSGGFEGGGPVQPVALRYPYTTRNRHAFLTTLGAHLRRLLLAPYVRMEVRYLPTHHPTPTEQADPERMAEAVRGVIADALGVGLHPAGAKELREEAAAARRERRSTERARE